MLYLQIFDVPPKFCVRVFLLDVLTDRKYRDIIQWIGNDGKFKFTDPEAVAKLWGERKKCPNMTYDHLSRSLRYYYNGDLIKKVGETFVYQFIYSVKDILKYDPQQLTNIMNGVPRQPRPRRFPRIDFSLMDDNDKESK